MLAHIASSALDGVYAFAISVEIAISSGLPGYHVVGLPTRAVKEGAVRIRSALGAVGGGMPRRKVTVNLAPADRPKEGASLELAIALGILVAQQEVPASAFEGVMVLGELGLGGKLRRVRGALAAALLAKRLGLRGVLLPRASAAEARCVPGLDIFVADHLQQVVDELRDTGALPTGGVDASGTREMTGKELDFEDVRGQAAARRAAEIAAAGGHNMLLLGPPGIGKTMIARRLPTILPPLTADEAVEATVVHSSVKATEGLIEEAPFRAPHHSISTPALIGGGVPPRAGEVSLAHRGVLFLDELPEFRAAALEALRQPLEDRQVVIGRVHSTVILPASFLLVGAANPCPCGWLGSRQRVCTCSPSRVGRYQAKLSGPLVDRIDLQVQVENVPVAQMRLAALGERSSAIRERVVRARQRQRQRLGTYGCAMNAAMGPKAVRATCVLDPACERILRRIHSSRGLTGRGLTRLIKCARTIADLAEREAIVADDLLEAASYRDLDRLAQTPLSGLSDYRKKESAGSCAAGARDDRTLGVVGEERDLGRRSKRS